jgi:TolB protein
MDVAAADVSMTRAAGTFEVGYPTLAWSPDGKWLAFGAGRFSTGIELYIMEANTGLVRRITDNAYRDDSPAWSPDSRRLVFTSAEDGYNRLYIIDIESGERHLLTNATFGYMPAWSPDGAQIVFGSNHATRYTDLYMINADGTGLRPLTPYLNASNLDEIEPGWLP